MDLDSIRSDFSKSGTVPRSKRSLIILEKVLRKKLKSKAIWIIIILGSFVVHLFPILSSILIPAKKLKAGMLVKGEGMLLGGYLGSMLFFIFTILFAAVVSSDLISGDIKDDSLILYFSRPLKSRDYILGKTGGALGIMTLFCLVPPLIYCLSVIATQTSSAYVDSLEVLGLTVIAGSFTSFIFLPYALLLSSLTKRKSYSGVGTFMSFFVLSVISQLFTEFDPNWKILSPSNLLKYSLDIIYGYELPADINQGLFILAMFLLVIAPLAALFYRIHAERVRK